MSRLGELSRVYPGQPSHDRERADRHALNSPDRPHSVAVLLHQHTGVEYAPDIESPLDLPFRGQSVTVRKYSSKRKAGRCSFKKVTVTPEAFLKAWGVPAGTVTD